MENGIDDDALEILVEALVHAEGLELLDLSYNSDIARRGFKALSPLLQKKSSSLFRLKASTLRGLKLPRMWQESLPKRWLTTQLLLHYP